MWARCAPTCTCPPHSGASADVRRLREDLVKAGTGPAIPTSHHHEAHDTDPHGPFCSAPGGERLQSADTSDGAGGADDETEDTDDPRGTDNATGTDDTGGNPTRVDDPQRLAKVALRQFDECDAFLDYVHTEGAERVGAYGFDDQRVLARHG